MVEPAGASVLVLVHIAPSIGADDSLGKRYLLSRRGAMVARYGTTIGELLALIILQESYS